MGPEQLSLLFVSSGFVGVNSESYIRAMESTIADEYIPFGEFSDTTFTQSPLVMPTVHEDSPGGPDDTPVSNTHEADGHTEQYPSPGGGGYNTATDSGVGGTKPL